MTREKDCKGLVRYLDGHEEEIAIAAVLDSEGLLFVPHILTFGQKIFKLVDNDDCDDYFLYIEEKSPKIPYHINLH